MIYRWRHQDTPNTSRSARFTFWRYGFVNLEILEINIVDHVGKDVCRTSWDPSNIVWKYWIWNRYLPDNMKWNFGTSLVLVVGSHTLRLLLRCPCYYAVLLITSLFLSLMVLHGRIVLVTLLLLAKSPLFAYHRSCAAVAAAFHGPRASSMTPAVARHGGGGGNMGLISITKQSLQLWDFGTLTLWNWNFDTLKLGNFESLKL